MSRDEHCRIQVEASPVYGGTAGDLMYDDCRVQKVQARIKWLKKAPSNLGYLAKV